MVLLDFKSKIQIYLQSSSGQGIGAIGVCRHLVTRRRGVPICVILRLPQWQLETSGMQGVVGSREMHSHLYSKPFSFSFFKVFFLPSLDHGTS